MTFFPPSAAESKFLSLIPHRFAPLEETHCGEVVMKKWFCYLRQLSRGLFMPLILGASGLFLSTSAHSGITELQIAEEQLAAVLEELARITARSRCPGEELTHELLQEPHFPERIDVRSLPYLRRAITPATVAVAEELSLEVYPPEIIVPLELQLISREHAYDPAFNDQVDITFPIDIVLSVSVDETNLKFECAGTEGGAALGDAICERFPETSLPLDFGAFGEFLGVEDEEDGEEEASSRLIGSGVAVNSDDRLAVRFEWSEQDCEGDPQCRAVDEAEWRSFFDGNFGPSQPEDEWSLLIDQLILRQAVETLFWNSLQTDTGLVLDGGIGTGWVPLGEDGAEVSLSINGHFGSGFCELSFSGQPRVHIYLDEGSLVLDGEVGAINRDTWDEVRCAAIWGLLGTWWDLSWYPVVTSVMTVVLHDRDGDLDQPEREIENWDCEVTDGSFSCRAPALDLSAGGIEFGLSHLYGEEDGLVAGGTVEVGHTEAPQLVANVGALDFDMNRCCTEFWYGSELRLYNYGRVCDDTPAIVDEERDPLDIYRIRSEGGGSWLVTLDMDQWDNFWAAPYPALVHVRSAGGIATYELFQGANAQADELEAWQRACAAERAYCALRGGMERLPEEYQRIDPRRDPDITVKVIVGEQEQTTETQPGTKITTKKGIAKDATVVEVTVKRGEAKETTAESTPATAKKGSRSKDAEIAADRAVSKASSSAGKSKTRVTPDKTKQAIQ
jgi:hypothetical protein